MLIITFFSGVDKGLTCRNEINKLTAEITRSTILTKNISGGLHYGDFQDKSFIR